MVSRCPSCGSPTPEDETICTSCGWDFVARKRTKPEGSSPAAPPAKAPPPPAAGGFALPPARNLNEPPVGQPTGLRPLPKLEPRGTNVPAEGENPFTLPTARGVPPPAEPPKKAPVPEKLPEKPAPAAPPPKDGLGARLFRSLRGETAPAKPAGSKEQPIPDAPPDAPEKKGFSLPPARVIETEEPVEPPPIEPPVEKPRREEAPRESETPKPFKPVKRPEPEEPKELPRATPEPSARFDDGDEPFAPPPAESLLPTAAREPIPLPARPEPASPPRREAPARPRTEAGAPSPEAAAAAAAKAAEARKSMVMIAAIAGAALGTASVLAVYLLMRPETTAATNPTTVSPFARGSSSTVSRPPFAPGGTTPAPAPPEAVPPPAPPQSPSPVLETPRPSGPIVVPSPTVPATPAAPPAAPAPAAPPAAAPDAARPAATFGSTPRLVVAGEEPKPVAKPKPAAAAPSEEPKARKPKGPKWTFEGVVFDLLTARGVFGAKLIFVDPDGNVVGETDTGPAGRYKISLPPGTGYKLKISHGDYTDRYIDEGDATSSLREATPEERRILMSAAARNLPWAGDPAKPVHRDLALVPRTPEEP